MYEVILFDNETKKRFSKKFWSKKELKKFTNKVIRSKKLTLLQIMDNSYLYD